MKQILYSGFAMMVLMLSGCTVSPSVLSPDVAGIGSAGTSENFNSARSTGSIVPSRDEGAVVDLPDSQGQKRMQANSYGSQMEAMIGQPAAGSPGDEREPALSADERHRQELINRGDLQEGQPLSVQ